MIYEHRMYMSSALSTTSTNADSISSMKLLVGWIMEDLVLTRLVFQGKEDHSGLQGISAGS